MLKEERLRFPFSLPVFDLHVFTDVHHISKNLLRDRQTTGRYPFHSLRDEYDTD